MRVKGPEGEPWGSGCGARPESKGGRDGLAWAATEKEK